MAIMTSLTVTVCVLQPVVLSTQIQSEMSLPLQVTLIPITDAYMPCDEAMRHSHRRTIHTSCLEKQHFEPEVAESLPFEKAAHAALAWLSENHAKCDVVHGHEWGGIFVDIITAVHYRQAAPGLRFAVETHGGHIWYAARCGM